MLSVLRPQAPTLRLAFNAHRAFSASSTRRTPEDEIARVMDLAREKAVGKPRPKAGGDTLRMLMFGKPGAGKGTLSSRLVENYDIDFISTGDVLRHEIAAGSEVGKEAEKVVASGGLVSDELMLEIVKKELERHRGKSWILDGFPRTLEQGKLLSAELGKAGRPLNMVVHLNVPDSVIMSRIAARWVHLPSGRVYNDDFNPPKVPGKDDETGEPLSKRPDDTPEVFSKRLASFYKSTAPLLEYFANEYPEALHSLSGSTSDELWPQLRELVDEFGLKERYPPQGSLEREHVREEADDLKDSAEVPVGGDKVAHLK
ncbi:adenylate kinase [Trichosporon asahii var. asahii CBS 2479]|uniref:GTP:AMP phosphotransferase, mitochondrial n=1 Tax=Trichosporon asahii var. asahii (strain ATCC 90039 / CBS 2479 / JCM 2466 / KCTC 7840 / NBRC 103889/ NCYC 2677 / UAMH 7654) TaxID=1186058 RepID=J6F609_TRIAS|nr:adenylate kinase [Trichosporon asahii var. asahii CBS 2479]EJT50742.1 adenylate kinase [Trichosporon asahii var. asahii CBS 2479]